MAGLEHAAALNTALCAKPSPFWPGCSTSLTAAALPRCLPHACCREPLAPVDVGAWDRGCLQGLQHWEAGDAPFTTVAALAPALPGGMGGSASSSLLAGSSVAADPAAAAALQAIVSARRGLIVAAELTHPEDVVAAAQLAQLLGWPVVADVLSGLRAGVPAAPPSAAGTAAAGGPAAVKVIHHFDNLLLVDRQQWGALRPDVVLQLGGHLTSKRANQFLEWCCLEGGGSSSGSGSSMEAGQQARPLQWVLVDRSPKRHDQFHLLSHRLQAPLPLLAAAVEQQLGAAGTAAGSSTSAAQQQQQAEQQRYHRLLQLLDAEASAAVDAALAAMPELTEPAVARALAQHLPPGEGLFVGNSMPIRDLDMYAAPAAAGQGASGARGTGSSPAAVQGVVSQGLGAPVAANRGASGIDGVLSTGKCASVCLLTWQRGLRLEQPSRLSYCLQGVPASSRLTHPPSTPRSPHPSARSCWLC